MSNSRDIEQLKPCPFCGVSEPTIDRNAWPKQPEFYFIECRDCPAAMEDETKAAVIAAWNTRTALTPSEEVTKQAWAKVREHVQQCLDNVPAFAKENGMSQDEADGREYAWAYVLGT